MECAMRWRAGVALLLLAGLAVAAPAAPAQKEPVRAALALGPVQQLGPAYRGLAAALQVQIRNVGRAECGACQIRVVGGGLVVSQNLPRIAPGDLGKVTVGGLIFPKPGKYVLTLVVQAPEGRVEFEGRKPHTTFELTVLDGPPVRRATPR